MTSESTKTPRTRRTSPDVGARFPDSALLGILIGAVIAVGMLIVGLLYTGAAAASVVDDPGALVRWSLPVVNLAYNISVAVTIGSLLLAAVVVPRSRSAAPGSALNPAWLRLLGLASGASIVWTLSAIGMLLLGYIDTVGGQALRSGNFSAQLGVYITGVDAGTYWLIALIMAAIVSTAVFGVRSHGGVLVLTVLALFGLLPQALTGHAADASNHNLAVSSIGLHIAGVSIWFGGLIALTLAASLLGRDIGAIVERYSSIAIFAYCLVAVSGISTSYVQVGSWAGMVSRYGALIIVKAIAMILLGFIGWWHREFIIARLKKDPDAAAPSILSGSRKAGAPAAPAGRTSSAAPAVRTSSARALFWRFVAGEMMLLGLASGAAVALSRSAKPAGQAPPSSPSAAETLTGYPLPPELTPLHWLTQWRLDLLWAVVAVIALIVYWRAVYAVRRRAGTWPIRRAVAWTLGLAVLVYATSGAPAVYGVVLFGSHMAAHFLIAFVAAALLAAAAPVTLLAESAAPRGDGSRGAREWILGMTGSAVMRLLVHPVTAAIVLAASIAVFYFSPLLNLAVANHVGHEVMVWYFLVVGYLFAQSVLAVDPAARSGAGRAVRLACAIGMACAVAALGIYLMHSTVLLDGDWFGNTGRPWGPDAIGDQQRGGLFALAVGIVPVAAMAVSAAAGRTGRDGSFPS
ncbi:cytochrome c oxidase assembly protein [Spelaeicoccus albus]|uniref:Putative copper resistance protein D n=1 Tax=Spelaeicoccus albus TaxID=1280376 RepID=A0A7Z0AA34_9MICO|nr:cytochrome c oxidase assembly protein [Spelaeicoccus albus]NYI66376.1 putative copper resistance protein D [Spelaeicoccus albus]